MWLAGKTFLFLRQQGRMFNHEILHFFSAFFYFDFIWGVLGEIDDIAYFYIDRGAIPIVEDSSLADSDNFSFVGFFFAVGEDNSAFCGVFYHERLNQDVVF
jgi:hypothetical protein